MRVIGSVFNKFRAGSLVHGCKEPAGWVLALVSPARHLRNANHDAMRAIALQASSAIAPVVMLGVSSARVLMIQCRQRLLLGLSLALVTGCAPSPSGQVQSLPIQQTWELQPGGSVGDHPIVGGLGDISIALRGDRVYAPFDGELMRNDIDSCYVFSSPDLPAYVFRLCGLRSPQMGRVRRGDKLGTADMLQFAALRRQPDGKWTMVEPANDVLQRVLAPQDVRVGGE